MSQMMFATKNLLELLYTISHIRNDVAVLVLGHTIFGLSAVGLPTLRDDGNSALNISVGRPVAVGLDDDGCFRSI